MGSGSSSFKGMVDDLRYYSSALNSGEIDQIYNSGGGDYQTIQVTGFGTTRITARQNGSEDFEKAIPVFNYLPWSKLTRTSLCTVNRPICGRLPLCTRSQCIFRSSRSF